MRRDPGPFEGHSTALPTELERRGRYVLHDYGHAWHFNDIRAKYYRQALALTDFYFIILV